MNWIDCRTMVTDHVRTGLILKCSVGESGVFISSFWKQISWHKHFVCIFHHDEAGEYCLIILSQDPKIEVR